MYKPEILTHPNIPKPLHGVSPRTILGEEAWNKIRKEVYKKYDYHCAACGVHKSEAKKHKWLEAHEYWNINNWTGECEVVSIEPLCHYCHNFIHSGRLKMIVGKEKTIDEVKDILSHGISVLKQRRLKMFVTTAELADKLNIDRQGVDSYAPLVNPSLKWGDYVLIFEGKRYPSKFESYDDWKDYYSKTLDI